MVLNNKLYVELEWLKFMMNTNNKLYVKLVLEKIYCETCMIGIYDGLE